nr:MAG TPA: hypothetical protein [Caudoviricetes sp.]
MHVRAGSRPRIAKRQASELIYWHVSLLYRHNRASSRESKKQDRKLRCPP